MVLNPTKMEGAALPAHLRGTKAQQARPHEDVRLERVLSHTDSLPLWSCTVPTTRGHTLQKATGVWKETWDWTWDFNTHKGSE